MHHFVLINDKRFTPDTKITEAIKAAPWIWTGAVRIVSNLAIPHTGRGNPVRFFFELYIRKCEPRERLIRIRDYASLDVNPWHYECLLPKLFRQETIDDIPQDVEAIPPEAQFGEQATEAELLDLVDVLSHVYQMKPFRTWDEYEVAMREFFAGVLPRNQINALARLGITLKGAPKYVV